MEKDLSIANKFVPANCLFTEDKLVVCKYHIHTYIKEKGIKGKDIKKKKNCFVFWDIFHAEQFIFENKFPQSDIKVFRKMKYYKIDELSEKYNKQANETWLVDKHGNFVLYLI
jgi:hypothetical protein